MLSESPVSTNFSVAFSLSTRNKLECNLQPILSYFSQSNPLSPLSLTIASVFVVRFNKGGEDRESERRSSDVSCTCMPAHVVRILSKNE